MAIVIKSKDGIKKHDSDVGGAVDRESDSVLQPVSDVHSVFDTLLDRLSNASFYELGPEIDRDIARHCQLLGKEYLSSIEGGQEAKTVIPRFTRPVASDNLLPRSATWTVHRNLEESEAEICYLGSSYQGLARDPWAAFSIALLKLYRDSVIGKSYESCKGADDDYTK